MTALDGLEGIALVADDILTYGTGDAFEEAEANHDHQIIALMERAAEKHIKFNPKIQDSRFKIIFLNKNYIHYTTHRIQVHN